MAGSDEGDGTGLDLADAIALLRDQIAEARRQIADPRGSGDKGVRFELGEITAELGLELARTGGVDDGLRFAVMGVGVEVGAKREKTESATHKLVVRLTPQTPAGAPTRVRDYG